MRQRRNSFSHIPCGLSNASNNRPPAPSRPRSSQICRITRFAPLSRWERYVIDPERPRLLQKVRIPGKQYSFRARLPVTGQTKNHRCPPKCWGTASSPTDCSITVPSALRCSNTAAPAVFSTAARNTVSARIRLPNLCSILTSRLAGPRASQPAGMRARLRQSTEMYAAPSSGFRFRDFPAIPKSSATQLPTVTPHRRGRSTQIPASPEFPEGRPSLRFRPQGKRGAGFRHPMSG